MQTRDDFLGGRVRLFQERTGLRATSDSVLVAAAVPAKPRETVLDVGTGNGVIIACLNARVPNIQATGIDCQADLIALAEKNAKAHGCDFQGIVMDILKRPSPLHGKQFHHVVTNPPFYHEDLQRQQPQVAKAYHQEIDREAWLNFCLRHVRAKGTLTVIDRPEAMDIILPILTKKLGHIEIIPIQSHRHESAKRVIIRGQMNSRQPLCLRAPLVMHTQSGKRTRTAEQILRAGAAIE